MSTRAEQRRRRSGAFDFDSLMNNATGVCSSRFIPSAEEILLPPPPSFSEGAAPLAAIPPPLMGIGCAKKRRGRPRKYNIDDNGDGGKASKAASMSKKLHSNPDKRAKKAQMAALGSAGQRFTLHIVNIAAGEDVYVKLSVFSQGQGAMFIISANGAISKAILYQRTYEGRFEIHSLAGSFVCTEVGGSPVGGLSVSFVDPDGIIVGGSVLGELMAATPVQVVVGTFLVDSKKTIVRTGKRELFTDTLPASLLEWPTSPAGLLSAPETFGNLGTGQNGHCALNTGSCSYSQQPQMFNMMYQNWIPSQSEAEMNNIEATTTGARTKYEDGGYQYQCEDEEKDFAE